MALQTLGQFDPNIERGKQLLPLHKDLNNDGGGHQAYKQEKGEDWEFNEKFDGWDSIISMAEAAGSPSSIRWSLLPPISYNLTPSIAMIHQVYTSYPILQRSTVGSFSSTNI